MTIKTFIFQFILLQIFSIGTIQSAGAAPRTTIDLKKMDCSRTAVEPGHYPQSFFCAQSMILLDQAMKKAGFPKKCESWADSGFQSLSDMASDGYMEESPFPIRFLPFASGKFLIEVQCSSAAYNEEDFYFFYDESDVPMESKTIPKGIVPKLILFPVSYGVREKPFNEVTHVKGKFKSDVDARDFDPKTKILFELIKGIGDGSFGNYNEYHFDDNGIPHLQVAYTRSEQDHLNGYSFERGKLPRGTGWQKYPGKPEEKGCLAKDFKQKTCP